MAASALFSRSGGRPTDTIPASPRLSPASLLAELAAEYPDVSTPVLAQALDRATVAAAALGGGAHGSAERIAVAARDRLDAVRERRAAAARRVGRPATYPGRDLR